ncbi:hypothetical protein COLO4_10924 [Corchorus olitorius]|uniref:DUF674 domain-containing protein n=1 Tax=Corchorus olitorius TaxID=93759 RepID=A0A1R3K6B6_9ROSI|nr:hypothetical protein COLO4_10924 [Corchorus olitorius]
MATANLSLKLLIDSKAQRVLFAEAGKDFVDCLFNIMSLPVATVIRLLRNQGMVGCIANLYESIEELSNTYIQPTADKDTLLKPLSNYVANVPLLLPNIQSPIAHNFYRCQDAVVRTRTSFHPLRKSKRNRINGTRFEYAPPSQRSRINGCNSTTYITDDQTSICPSCNTVMNIPVTFVNGQTSSTEIDEGGYVKGVVTYMIMDDLVVSPISTISSIAMLNKLNVKEVGALKEKLIEVGMNEGVELLKASLQSKTVFTDVFLGK